MEHARKHAAEIFTLFKCILLNEMKDFIFDTMMQKNIYKKPSELLQNLLIELYRSLRKCKHPKDISLPKLRVYFTVYSNCAAEAAF